MRLPLLLAALALVVVALPALAIPAPGLSPPAVASLAPLAAATAAPVVATVSAFAAALGWGTWVLGHWQDIGALMALAVAFYQAVRAHQWAKLTALAGELTFAIATLTNFDNDQKRRMAETELYSKAGAVAHGLFSEQQFSTALEYGYKLIAKPKLGQKAS